MMWSTSPQFSAQVRWMNVLGLLLFVGYLVLFRFTVKNDGAPAKENFLLLSYMTSASEGELPVVELHDERVLSDEWGY
jgi:hypothetical protein